VSERTPQQVEQDPLLYRYEPFRKVLPRLASLRSRSVARRLGWLLDQFREGLELEPLREVALAQDGHPTRLVRALQTPLLVSMAAL
jgi:hypothetical protein